MKNEIVIILQRISTIETLRTFNRMKRGIMPVPVPQGPTCVFCKHFATWWPRTSYFCAKCPWTKFHGKWEKHPSTGKLAPPCIVWYEEQRLNLVDETAIRQMRITALRQWLRILLRQQKATKLYHVDGHWACKAKDGTRYELIHRTWVRKESNGGGK